MAEVLGRSVSTISDELKRNQVKGSYDPKKAHHKAGVRRKEAKYQGMKIVGHRKLWNFVETHLLAGQSPEGIAGRLRQHDRDLPSVSKDSIYRFIKSPYGRQIEHARERRRRRKSRPKTVSLAGRKFIEERPKQATERTRVGDTEVDFIVSGKGGSGILLVVTDRKTRVTFLEKILPVSIQRVHQAFLRIQKRFPEWTTITTDNDILFQKHQELAAQLKVKIFFCHPYHSWEKGGVENVNKHIRQDIPKGSDLSRYSKHFIGSIERKLNRRFLHCLKYATPEERLEQERKQKNTGRGVRIEPVG